MKKLLLISLYASVILVGCNNEITLINSVGSNKKWIVCRSENLDAGTYYFTNAMHLDIEHPDPSKRHLNDYPVNNVEVGRWLYINQPTPIMATSIIQNRGTYEVGNKEDTIDLKCGDKIMLDYSYEVTLKKIK